MLWHLFGYCVLSIMIVAMSAIAFYAAGVAINAQNRLKRIALAMSGDDPDAADRLNIDSPDDIVDAAAGAIRFHRASINRVADVERQAGDRALAALRLIDPAQLAPHLFETLSRRINLCDSAAWDDVVKTEPLVGAGWNDVASEALDVVESAIRSYCAAPTETAGDASPAEVSP